MARGGQRPKEKAECPTCHQQVAVHTWSGQLFSHECGTPEERKARRSAKRAAAKARLKGPCPKCGHDLSKHPLRSVVAAWQITTIGCGHRVKVEGQHRMSRCGCQEWQPEPVGTEAGAANPCGHGRECAPGACGREEVANGSR